MVYLDHAATSWPKPPVVLEAMNRYLEHDGGNPGRAGHRLAVAAGRAVLGARMAVAELFGAPDPLRVVFAMNATHAINLAIRGVLHAGDRAVTTSLEHNAVMRPLRGAAMQGVVLDVVGADGSGAVDLASLERACRTRPRLVILGHANSVTGRIQPLGEAAGIAHRYGALVLVDAAQTGGCVELDLEREGVDLLAFTGHKGLQGPPGTGGLVLGSRVDPLALEPLVRGGTGSRSEQEVQPEDLPDRFESGTANGVGLAGLAAGVRWVLDRGVGAIRRHEGALIDALREMLSREPQVTLLGPQDAELRSGVLSVRVKGRSVSEVGELLDERFSIATRVGLHCAPAVHRELGTFPEGTVRFAVGPCTTEADVEAAADAVAWMAR